MFAETTHRQLLEANAHCASICPHKDGVLISYYTGPECTDNQRVHVEYWEKDELKGKITLPRKTGNAILVPAKRNQAVLVFSMFNDEKDGKRPQTPVDRWGFCTLWKTKLRFSNERLKAHDCTVLGVEPQIGLLPRCNPIRVDRKWYLPLYQEHDPHGVIVNSKNGWDWEISGKIGTEDITHNGRFGRGSLMQPSIWYDGKQFNVLCRDVSQSKRAWHSSSVDAKTWTPPSSSVYDNCNNSIQAQAIKSSKPWIIWNRGPGRSSLMLGRFGDLTVNMSAKASIQLNMFVARASYPNSCIDYSGNLNIVHTEGFGLTHHVIDREALDFLARIKEPKTPKDFDWWNYKISG